VPLLDSGDSKKFKQKEHTHETYLDGLKQRLKEHRHVRMHSQAAKLIHAKHEDALRYISRVSDDMKEYYRYFKDFFSS